MREPPDENHRSDDKQPKRLVPTKRTPLHLAALMFGDLLIVRLDAAFYHRNSADFTTDQYRGTLDFDGLSRTEA